MTTLILLVIFFISTGCGGMGSNGSPVHLIVPAGFQGIVQIVVDGTDSGGYRFVNGQNEYLIPVDGLLHVKSAKPFELWHVESASCAGGQVIYGDDDTPTDKAAPRFHSLGSHVANGGPLTEEWVVGPPEYCKRVQQWHESGELGQPPTASGQSRQ